MASAVNDTNAKPDGKGTTQDSVPHRMPAELSVDASRYHASLRADLRPATALEEILVQELARHAASMEISANAEGQVLRFAARHAEYLPQVEASPELQAEAMVAASMTNPATERVERYGQAHRRAFYRALAQLQLMRTQTPVNDECALSAFNSEEACETYLLGRAQAARPLCPRCRKRKQHYLRARRRWECSSCGMQSGIRRGTVMEGSPLPLATWFKAILLTAREPGLPARDLAERIGLTRLATVRNMAKKIQAAVDSADAETLLAGLHRLGELGSGARSTNLQQVRAPEKFFDSHVRREGLE